MESENLDLDFFSSQNTFSSSLMLGQSAFTTIRIWKGHPLFWDKHIDRLGKTCEFLGLPVPHFPKHLKWIQENDCSECLYRLTVTPKGDFGQIRSLPPTPKIPVSVWLSDWQVHPQLAEHKTGSYLPYLMAHKEAQTQGCFEGFLKRQDFWVDGSKTGFLLKTGDQWIVPKGGLPSITRNAFLEGHSYLTLPISLETFENADQMWILGSGVGAQSVRYARWPGGTFRFKTKKRPPFSPDSFFFSQP